jgi:PAT family beta-lactamase induction signal transducer AmpG
MRVGGTPARLAGGAPAAPAAGSAGDRTKGLAARLIAIAVDPFRSFMRRPSWLMILAFVALFKLGDALASALLGPFALDLGFDKETVAAVSKGVGLASVLAGGFVGGALGRIVPLVTGLWIAGLAQMLSNLAFTALALIGPATWALTAAVAIESFCGGVGTVLFVAFLSQLCSDRAHTATQYALLSALAALGRTLFSASAGYIAVAVGWPLFFGLTAVAALPGLVLLWWLARTGVLGPVDGRPAPEGQPAE